MDQNDLPSMPNPALIMPLGSSAIRNVLFTLPIYFRSDPRRKHVTKVAAPVSLDSATEEGTSGFDILDFEKIQELPPDSFSTANFSINSLTMNWQIISDRFDHIWHDLRSHASLIEAGFSGKTIPDTNIIIIAHLWDSTASLLLLPLLYRLKALTEQTPTVMIQVLLDVTHLPGDDYSTEQSARIYRLLTELENRIFPKIEFTDDPLLQFLKFPQSLSLDHIRYYLLDTIKENNYVVSTRAELDAIVSSSLLTLLNGEVAYELTESLTQDVNNEHRPFFASCGSTSIIYDPDPVIDYCAARLGAEYLPKDYWPTTGIDKLLVQNLLTDVREKIGSDVNWVFRLLKDTAYTLVQDLKPWGIRFGLEGLDLHLPEPDEIKECDWFDRLTEYTGKLFAEKIPSVISGLDNDIPLLTSELVETQKTFDAGILQDIELHPNVLMNGRKVLLDWKTSLGILMESATEMQKGIPDAAAANNEMNASIQSIPDALKDFPPLPLFFKLFPKGRFKSLILRVYSVIWLRGDYLKLDNALKDTREKIAISACIPVKSRLVQGVIDTVEAILKEVSDTINEINTLEEKLRTVQKQLDEKSKQSIPGETLFQGLQNFQLFVATPEFTKKCFSKYEPEIGNIHKILLEDMGFLSNWKTKDVNQLIGIIMDYGRKVYSPVRAITIDRAIEETKALGGDEATIRQKILDYSQSTTCLLNPDWDSSDFCGGGNHFFALIDKENNPVLFPLTRNQWENWKVVFTGEPYYYAFGCSLLHVPLKTVERIIKPGELTWNGLSTRKKAEVDVIPGKIVVNPSVTVNDIDEDTVEKVFKWSFTPKGSPNTVEQTITLNINRKRYEEFRAKERIVDDYPKYCEEDLPEIKDLTQAFYKLHNEHNWSTYNQAYNILTYVQSCFPYSFDKDSKGVDEWPRYPIETLMDGTGDCEDVAILCAAVLARLGFASVLLAYPRHLAFGVQAADALKGEYVLDESTGRKYYYGEATAKGWRLGEIPPGYRGIKPDKVYPVNVTIAE